MEATTKRKRIARHILVFTTNQTHMDLFIHFLNKECDRKTSFKSIKGLVEYLFNYYFAVNNK